MKIDLLILQLAVLFLPGLIWARLDAYYAAKIKPTETEFFLRAFVFGLCTYAITFLLYSALGWDFTLIDLREAETKEIFNRAILKEILWAGGIGLLLAILWIYASTYKWLTRVLQFIKATKKYGDEDVWDFTFNSSIAAVEYVHFRDFAHGFVYAGWVRQFSETEKLRELVLRDVEVYDFNGKKLFETPLVYLSRPPEDIHLEFPYLPEDHHHVKAKR